MLRTNTVEEAEWMAPGRKSIDGYLLVLPGPRKGRRGGILDEFLKDVIEETGRMLPRYPDLHAVWFGYNPDGPPRNKHYGPMLRYKASRPIDGLRRECNHHRVRLTCTVTEQWKNGLGAYIVRATGECLECPQTKPESDGGDSDG